MAKLKLQLVDPAGSFEHDNQTLSGREIKEFPDTNEAVKRAIAGRIVRVVRDEPAAPSRRAAAAASS